MLTLRSRQAQAERHAYFRAIPFAAVFAMTPRPPCRSATKQQLMLIRLRGFDATRYGGYERARR